MDDKHRDMSPGTAKAGRTPYESAPPKAFWRTGVLGQNWSDIDDLYTPKFKLTPDIPIMTAGSCFAQHIGSRLKAHQFNVMDLEPPPRGLKGEEGGQRFGYGLYSARYGNIYTARQLLQLALEANNRHVPGEIVWSKGDKFVDALRPAVEPYGLDTPGEVLAHRSRHLLRVRRALKETHLMVFTFGLTEAWLHTESGSVFPIVPGTTAGGVFDTAKYSFRNFTASEILADFLAFRALVRRANPDIRFLLTVSPVPLVATASGKHVLAATMYSKSVLRAVAGQLSDEFADIDYFPSYELVAAPFSRQFLYDPQDARSVPPDVVDLVMSQFFKANGVPYQMLKGREIGRSNFGQSDIACEELLLQAFAP